jgi:hypothetical protein
VTRPGFSQKIESEGNLTDKTLGTTIQGASNGAAACWLRIELGVASPLAQTAAGAATTLAITGR